MLWSGYYCSHPFSGRHRGVAFSCLVVCCQFSSRLCFLAFGHAKRYSSNFRFILSAPRWGSKHGSTPSSRSWSILQQIVEFVTGVFLSRPQLGRRYISDCFQFCRSTLIYQHGTCSRLYSLNADSCWLICSLRSLTIARQDGARPVRGRVSAHTQLLLFQHSCRQVSIRLIHRSHKAFWFNSSEPRIVLCQGLGGISHPVF